MSGSAPLTREIASCPDLACAIERVSRSLSAASGAVHVLDSDGLLHLTASYGIPAAVLDQLRTLPMGKGLAGLAVERRQAVSSQNVQADALADVPLESEPNGLGAVAVPIFRGDAVIGALEIGASGERTFDENEIDSLLELGRTLAARFIGAPQSSAA